MKVHRIPIVALLSAGALATTASAAMALPPPSDDPIIHCPTGYRLVGDVCVKIPPANNPAVSLSLARQTTDRSGIHVAGAASDADQPDTALTVKIRVDGVQVKTVTANLPDPGVATPFAATSVTPAGHSYDVIVPGSATAQTVCVTAVNVGSGSDTTVCKPVDTVVEFDGNSLSYDLDRLQITKSSLESLDKVTTRNDTNVQQSTTISGEKTREEVHGWSHTEGVKVTADVKVGIPLLVNNRVSIEGSLQFVQNGTETTTRKFTWSQPVLVPPKSEVVATVAVTETTLTVPYTLSGTYLYSSGARVAGTTGGTFTGTNNHDLNVTLTQFNLDGTPAATPVQQPQPTLLEVS
jgi:hypothetical protein